MFAHNVKTLWGVVFFKMKTLVMHTNQNSDTNSQKHFSISVKVALTCGVLHFGPKSGLSEILLTHGYL